MAQVDINDDNIDKFIVWHYRFDPSTSHFRKIPLAAFSSSREAKKLFKFESKALEKRKSAGLADKREYISSDQQLHGHKKRAREIRIFRKSIKSQIGRSL
jgi:hypothetical protein